MRYPLFTAALLAAVFYASAVSAAIAVESLEAAMVNPGDKTLFQSDGEKIVIPDTYTSREADTAWSIDIEPAAPQKLPQKPAFIELFSNVHFSNAGGVFPYFAEGKMGVSTAAVCEVVPRGSNSITGYTQFFAADLQTQQIVSVSFPQKLHLLSVSPDGTKALISKMGSWGSFSKAKTLYVTELKNGLPHKTLLAMQPFAMLEDVRDEERNIDTAVWIDNQTFMVQSAGRNTLYYHAGDNKLLWSRLGTIGHISPNGRYMLSGGCLLDIPTCDVIGRFNDPNVKEETNGRDFYGGCRFSPDGTKVASLSGGSARVRIWDAKTGKLEHRFCVDENEDKPRQVKRRYGSAMMGSSRRPYPPQSGIGYGWELREDRSRPMNASHLLWTSNDALLAGAQFVDLAMCAPYGKLSPSSSLNNTKLMQFGEYFFTFVGGKFSVLDIPDEEVQAVAKMPTATRFALQPGVSVRLKLDETIILDRQKIADKFKKIIADNGYIWVENNNADQVEMRLRIVKMEPEPLRCAVGEKHREKMLRANWIKQDEDDYVTIKYSPLQFVIEVRKGDNVLWSKRMKYTAPTGFSDIPKEDKEAEKKIQTIVEEYMSAPEYADWFLNAEIPKNIPREEFIKVVP